MTGFLDNLPDLGDGRDRRRRPKPKPPPDGVLWVRVRCPSCDSADCPVYNTNSIPTRYHRCSACGRTFKSIEANYRKGDPDDGTV